MWFHTSSRTSITKCRTWLEPSKTFVTISSLRLPPSYSSILGCAYWEGNLVLWKLQSWRLVQIQKIKSYRCKVCLGMCTLGGSTREELLKLANKDSIRRRQWAYLSVKLEDCNPNRSELEETWRVNTQAELTDPKDLLKGIKWQGCPQRRGADRRAHPACVSIPSFALTIAHFHGPRMGGKAPSSPSRVLLTEFVTCFDSISEGRAL